MMRSRLPVILLILCFFLRAEEPYFRYRTLFPDGRIPASGIADAQGRCGPLRLAGGVSISPSGTLQLDGRSGYLAIPGSADISLRQGATLTVIAKFRKDASGALFYRRGELLAGRNGLRQFYCNISGAKTGSPGIRVGEFQHLALVLTPEREGKIGILTYVNGEQTNKSRLSAVAAVSQSGADLEFGHAPDRGASWFFDGEVAELSFYARPLARAELAADINRFLAREMIDEPLHGGVGKGRLYGSSARPAGNRRSRRDRAVLLTDSRVEWRPDAAGDWFAEVMFKSFSQPERKRELMTLVIGSRRWTVELPAGAFETVLRDESGSAMLNFPSGTLQPQPWMSNDAMWHHLAVVRRNGRLRFAFDGFLAPGEIDVSAEPLSAIAVGGAGRAAFSDFRLVGGSLTKEELRSRYLALYTADDGRTGLLNISEKLNERINRR